MAFSTSPQSPARMVIVARDAVVATALSCAVGILVHLVRPDAIHFIADREYELFVPCPESGGEVGAVPPDAAGFLAADTFVVDARPKREFLAWSFPGAMHIPYDYLDPTPKDTLRELAETIARSRAKRVVVYGDGDTPDTGEQLAKEVSGHGIKHVFFVEGGAPSLSRSTELGGER